MTSVTCTPPAVPPVRFQISQESMVPNAISPRSARVRESGYVVEQPGRLGAREVAGQRQPGGVAEPVLPVAPAEFGAERGGPGVLPDDRVVYGFAGRAVPKDRRLTLVGDAERAELLRAQPGPGEGARHHGLHLGPDLGGVVLHPAGFGKDLPVLALVDGDDRPVLVEDDAAAGGGALVDRGDELVRHGYPWFRRPGERRCRETTGSFHRT